MLQVNKSLTDLSSTQNFVSGLGQVMKEKEWLSGDLGVVYLEQSNKRSKYFELRFNWSRDWYSGLSVYSFFLLLSFCYSEF